MTPDPASVLIAEDDPELADLYALWLEDEYRVETAVDGAAALDALDAETDVVLLDRRMPGPSGETVLETVRNRELDCRVAMVTGVEPDFDVVGLGFDDYLVKPVTEAELRDSIEQLLLRTTYDEQLQTFFALASKRALLAVQKTDAELRSSQEYAELEDRLAVRRVQVDDTMQELLEQDGFRRLCRDLTRASLFESG